jgi:hypothetical protein
MPNVRTLFGQLARLWRPAMTLGLLVFVQTACVRYPAPSDDAGVSRYVSGVQLTDSVSAATIRSGTPTSDPNAPALHAMLGPTALEGGTTELTATSATPFTRVAVTVPGSGSYWDVTLARPTTVATIRLTFAERLPSASFEVRVAAADNAAYGIPASGLLTALAVADEGHVTLEWDSPADLGVRAVDRSGSELSWNVERRSQSVACGTVTGERKNAWTGAGLDAPPGAYRMRLSYSSECARGATHYTLTANSPDGRSQWFSGILPGLADRARADEVALADR